MMTHTERPIKLFLVDCRPPSRNSLLANLQAFQRVCIIGDSVSASDALARASQLQPDVMLVCDCLPEIDAIHLTGKFQERCPEMGILISSTQRDGAYWTSALRVGARGCLLTDAPAHQIIEAIEAVASGSTHISPSVASALAGADGPITHLSSHEREVLTRLAQGMPHEAIAKELGIAVGTVEAYRASLRCKFSDDAGNGLLAYAVQRAWMPASDTSLASVLRNQTLPLSATLRMAVGLVQQLGLYHSARLVHGAVKPTNIFVRRTEEGRWIADLSAPAEPILDYVDPEHPLPANAPAEDWAYLSPERTGRIHQRVDHRSDFYSFGITLCQMLTGCLPFEASDAMEWVHCHVARLPRAPAEVLPGSFRVVSDLAMKLLAKRGDERYQSARGLELDLSRCLRALEATGYIDSFALGEHDASGRLRISRTLLGRDAQLGSLRAAFDRVKKSKQAEIVLVSGHSGIGKSSLVSELRAPIAQAGGRFIAGKFDRQCSDTPHMTLAQAFRDPVQQVLSESEQNIATWRRQLNDALGINGRLIVEMVPEVELIIGPQPSLAELAPEESKNRFGMVFRQFVSAFAREEHPLTLFMDDLQWADSASLMLLGDLATHPQMRSLLIVGAYRDNEVGTGHPLVKMLDGVRKEGTRVTDIQLSPLSQAHVAAILAESLDCGLGDTRSLAHLIHQKTAGNPLFVIQLLTELHDNGLISFDVVSGTWQWDIAGIQARNYTDNIMSLMTGKLLRLSVPTRQALVTAACLGSHGDTNLLALALRLAPAEVCDAVDEAVRSGLLQCSKASFQFNHDRGREASYLLIPQDDRAKMHLEIGRLLLSGLTSEEQEQRVFDVVHQLNHGVALLTDPVEIAELRRLNFLAARKAKTAIAYASARDHLLLATGLLDPNAWKERYDEAFAIHLGLAECEFVTGNDERADELLDLMLAHAASDRDRATIHLLRVSLYQLRGRFGDALEVALTGLRLFDVIFPDAELEARAMLNAEQSEITVNLAGRSIPELTDAPILADLDVRAIIALLTAAVPPAALARPTLYPLIAVKAMNYTLRYGNCEESPLVFTCYARLLSLDLSHIPEALAYSDLGMSLNERTGNSRLRGSVLLSRGILLAWKLPFADCMPILDQAFVACVEVGNLTHAGFVAMVTVLQAIDKGDPLDKVILGAQKFTTFLRQT